MQLCPHRRGMECELSTSWSSDKYQLHKQLLSLKAHALCLSYRHCPLCLVFIEQIQKPLNCVWMNAPIYLKQTVGTAWTLSVVSTIHSVPYPAPLCLCWSGIKPPHPPGCWWYLGLPGFSACYKYDSMGPLGSALLPPPAWVSPAAFTISMGVQGDGALPGLSVHLCQFPAYHFHSAMVLNRQEHQGCLNAAINKTVIKLSV